MRTIAIVQARMRSTRLPGKILFDLHGKPVIWHVVRATKQVAGVDGVIVALGGDPRSAEDVHTAAVIRDSCRVNVFIGDEFDVLGRYYDAAAWCCAQAVVRITADDPLLDVRISSEVVARFLAGGVDYCSNVGEIDPDGWDTEVITFEALRRVHKTATSARDREHVTTYVRAHPDEFRIAYVPIPEHRRREPRLSVNTLEDLMLVRSIMSQAVVA